MEYEYKKLNQGEYLTFYKSLRAGKISNSHGCFVSLDAPEYYAKTDNFILGDGISGFAIKNGDLIGVHKNSEKAKEANVTNLMPSLMIYAIENGANKLDCYGDFLAQAYIKFGFVPVGKMAFNIDYNPDWPVEKFGKPMVIAMMQGCRSLEELCKLQKEGRLINFNDIIKDLPEFEDYMLMLKYRDKILEKAVNSDYNYEKCIEIIRDKALLGGLEDA